MSTMHHIPLTLGYEERNSRWWVIRNNVAYRIPEGLSVQDFIVLQAQDYHWERCQEWPGRASQNVFYTQMLHLHIEYSGTIENNEFITRWWKAHGRGLVDFKNQTQWSDIQFIEDWLRERVSEVEQECMMRILTKEAA